MLINVAFAYDDCLFFEYCGGNSHHTFGALPSSTVASNLNPGTVSDVKGFGLETLYQKGNPVSFNFVSGNGKIGALVSPTLENSFFGNRSIEIDDLQLIRQLNKKQYDNKKLSLSLGAKILSRRDAEITFGLSAKRNPDIKNINPGISIGAKFNFLRLGAYFYQDDIKFKLGNYSNPYTGMLYSNIYGSSTYQEKFSVDTYTLGVNLGNLSLDTGLIKTRYHFYTENTRVYIYSSSYAYKSFLINFAVRKEYSPNLYYKDKKMIFSRKKTEDYYGFQYLINSNVLLGLQHNNFLLNEWSATLTIYF